MDTEHRRKIKVGEFAGDDGVGGAGAYQFKHHIGLFRRRQRECVSVSGECKDVAIRNFRIILSEI